jgi:hypothetical protein
VRRKEDRAVGRELREQAVEAQALFRIEAGGGLVDDDQPRVSGDGLGQAEPLPHPARVGFHLAVRGER